MPGLSFSVDAVPRRLADDAASTAWSQAIVRALGVLIAADLPGLPAAEWRRALIVRLGGDPLTLGLGSASGCTPDGRVAWVEWRYGGSPAGLPGTWDLALHARALAAARSAVTLAAAHGVFVPPLLGLAAAIAACYPAARPQIERQLDADVRPWWRWACEVFALDDRRAEELRRLRRTYRRLVGVYRAAGEARRPTQPDVAEAVGLSRRQLQERLRQLGIAWNDVTG